MELSTAHRRFMAVPGTRRKWQDTVPRFKFIGMRHRVLVMICFVGIPSEGNFLWLFLCSSFLQRLQYLLRGWWLCRSLFYVLVRDFPLLSCGTHYRVGGAETITGTYLVIFNLFYHLL
jgi:hypothetical protein